MYWKMVKWRRGSAKQRDYYWDKGWFFNDENGHPVGPFKTENKAWTGRYIRQTTRR